MCSPSVLTQVWVSCGEPSGMIVATKHRLGRRSRLSSPAGTAAGTESPRRVDGPPADVSGRPDPAQLDAARTAAGPDHTTLTCTGPPSGSTLVTQPAASCTLRP